MRVKFTQEAAAFIRENAPGRSTRELADMLQARFGQEFPPESVANYKKRNKIKSGLPPGGANGRRVFTDAMRAVIDQAGSTPKSAAIARELRERFGTAVSAEQVRAYRWRNGLLHAAPGSQTARARGRYVRGCTPANALPDGSLVCRSDGYLYRKQGSVWEPEHRLHWRKANGKIPPDMLLIFLDGNRRHVDAANLAPVRRDEHLQMIRRGLRFADAAHTGTGVLIARLQRMTVYYAGHYKNSLPKAGAFDRYTMPDIAKQPHTCGAFHKAKADKQLGRP